MIIDFTAKMIFIHIPKTAGTSITEWLKGELTNKRHNFKIYWGKMNENDLAHLKYHEIKDLLEQMHLNIDDFFIWAVIRNPIHRFYSAYNQPYLQHLNNLGKTMSIADTLKMIKNGNNSMVHFDPMIDYVSDAFNIVKVNYLVRFENLDYDIKVIADKFNLNMINYVLMSKLNVTNTANVDTHNQLITFEPEIKEIYALDFKTFNY